MPNNDYRLTRYCGEYRIQEQKDALSDEIAKAHPRAKSAYNTISGNREYKQQLAVAYQNRCAYCGVPVACISIDGFQIDHIVSRTAVQKGNAVVDTGVDSIDNLALSCNVCNSRKGGFPFDETCHAALSPDRNLGQTFFRDDDLRISIPNELSDSSPIRQFYKRMRLSDELHRIDYVLASLLDMRDFLRRSSNLNNVDDLILCISAVIGELLPKRNSHS